MRKKEFSFVRMGWSVGILVCRSGEKFTLDGGREMQEERL